jgi:hypothetical protein
MFLVMNHSKIIFLAEILCHGENSFLSFDAMQSFSMQSQKGENYYFLLENFKNI